MKTRIMITLLSLALVLVGTACEKNPVNPIINDGGNNGGGDTGNLVARISATPVRGEAPLRVVLDGSASSAKSKHIVDYTWTFGDGSLPATGSMTDHVYSTEGDYTITLTITDDTGAQNTTSTRVVVNAASGPVSFPFYPGAQWVYDINYNANGSIETGQVTATLVQYNNMTQIGKISVSGQRTYNGREQIPHTIYLRETANSLERSEGPSGPWSTVFSFNQPSWNSGGFLFLGEINRTVKLSPNNTSTPAGSFESIHTRAHYDNWGDPYALEIYENTWAEDFHPAIGLLKCYRYSYYHNRDPQWPLPTSSTMNVILSGYAIPMPDGTILTGGTGAQLQLMAEISPQASDYEVIEEFMFIVNDNRAPLNLSFTMEMNRSSVEQAFTVKYYEGATLREMAGTFNWINNMQALWVPSTPYSTTSVYLIDLTQTAMTQDGRNLSQQLMYGLTYEP